MWNQTKAPKQSGVHEASPLFILDTLSRQSNTLRSLNPQTVTEVQVLHEVADVSPLGCNYSTTNITAS